MNAELMKSLAICQESHGSPGNAATVYGHVDRTCIRISGTSTWVYSPGASTFEELECVVGLRTESSH